jgi:hypothetical protein
LSEKPGPQYAIEPDHHIKSKIPADSVFQSSRNTFTDTVIDLYRRSDEKFIAICRDHGTHSKPGRFRVDAERARSHPQGWCSECRMYLGICEENADALPVVAGEKCGICNQFKSTTCTYSHVSSSRTMKACKPCRDTDEFRERYERHFGTLVQKTQSEWKGLSKKKRASLKKRIAMTGPGVDKGV